MLPTSHKQKLQMFGIIHRFSAYVNTQRSCKDYLHTDVGLFAVQFPTVKSAASFCPEVNRNWRATQHVSQCFPTIHIIDFLRFEMYLQDDHTAVRTERFHYGANPTPPHSILRDVQNRERTLIVNRIGSPHHCSSATQQAGKRGAVTS